MKGWMKIACAVGALVLVLTGVPVASAQDTQVALQADTNVGVSGRCFNGMWASSNRVYFYVNMSANWEMVRKPSWVRSTSLVSRYWYGYVVYSFSPSSSRAYRYAGQFTICAR